MLPPLIPISLETGARWARGGEVDRDLIIILQKSCKYKCNTATDDMLLG